MFSLDHVSENTSIDDEYPNFNNKFNIDILTGSEDQDDGYAFSLNDYSSEVDYENISFLMTIHNLTNDEYKMVL